MYPMKYYKGMTTQDMREIAAFFAIVKAYLKMKRIEERNK